MYCADCGKHDPEHTDDCPKRSSSPDTASPRTTTIDGKVSVQDLSGGVAAGMYIKEQHIHHAPAPGNQTSVPSEEQSRNAASSSHNPFIWRQGITEKSGFFNRDSAQRQLRHFLHGRQNCQIVGERRIGKTSLLLQIGREAATWEPGMTVAYMNMHNAVCHTLPGFLRRAGTQLGWPAPLNTLTEFAECIEKLCGQNRRLTLCIDEFEEFTLRRDTFIRDFFLTLRACSQIGLSLVTASRLPLNQLTEPGDPTSPFFNVFSVLPLGPFTPEDAADYLTIERPGIPAFITEEKAKILTLANNHPLALQVACYHVVESHERKGDLTTAIQNAQNEMRSMLPDW